MSRLLRACFIIKISSMRQTFLIRRTIGLGMICSRMQSGSQSGTKKVASHNMVFTAGHGKISSMETAGGPLAKSKNPPRAAYMAPNPTTSRLDDPKSIEGLQFYADLINEHRVMPTPVALANLGMGVDHMFASGRLAMFLSGIWETPALRQKYSFRWDVAMFPKSKDGIRRFGSGGTGYGILRTSEHPEAAWEVVKVLTSAPVQGELARRGLAQ